MNYYFVGIGGSGMSPLAEYLLQNGEHVSGSDSTPSKVTQHLASLGGKIFYTHDSQNIPNNAILVRSSAIPTTNPEVQAAHIKNYPILHRSDLLQQLMSEKHSITVAGTHGKTTTSAMLTWILDSIGEAPSAILGGRFCNSNKSALKGCSKLFVAEADESDGSFLKYNSETAIITNIEPDHLDHYGSFAHLQQAFMQHIHNIKPHGKLIYNYDDPTSKELITHAAVPTISFGFHPEADLSAYIHFQDGKQTTFEVNFDHQTTCMFNCLKY